MKRVRYTTTCQVSDQPVRLTVTIGDAQMGASRVRLDDDDVATGSITDLVIGHGGAVSGRTLRIKTVVTDVNNKTNNTDVRYDLSGGRASLSFTLGAVVEEEGDSVIYLVDIELRA